MGQEDGDRFLATEYPRDPPYKGKAECPFCHSIVPSKEIIDGLCEVCRLILEREKEGG